MRWPKVAAAATIAIAALGARPSLAASGVSLGGFAGAGYLLEGLALPGGSSTRSTLSFNVGASVSGGIIKASLLRWSASASYSGARGWVEQRTSALNVVTFNARTTLLSGFPTPISLFATRAYSDASQTEPGRSTFGNSIQTGFGGGINVGFPRLPRLSASLARTMSETFGYDGARLFNGLTTFSAGVNQSVPVFEYAGLYDTSWSDGSWSEQSYRSHRANLRAAAHLADNVQLQLSDDWFLRLPTTNADTNPRYDTNNVRAVVSWSPTARLVTNASYSFLQSSVAAGSTLSSDFTSHAVDEQLRWELRKGIHLSQFAGAQVASARILGQALNGASQHVGGGLTWLKDRPWGSVTVGGSALGGLAEPGTGPVEPTWGVSSDLQVTARGGRLAGSAAYSLSYSNGGIALFGSLFRQTVRLEGSWLTPLPTSRLRAYLGAVGSRRDSALVGTALSRSIQGELEGVFLQHAVRLSASMSDGLGVDLQNPVISDGLFLPAGFNTRRSDLGLSYSTSFDRGRLGLSVAGRLAWLLAPGRELGSEAGVSASISYTIAKFRISLDERFVYGMYGASWQRNNILMANLSRSFDWAF